MTTAMIIRQERDWRGDPKGGKVQLPLEVLIGGPAPIRVGNSKEETATTEGQVGVYVDQENSIEEGDRLLIEGDKWIVVGKPLWNHDHSFSGTDTLSDMYWVKVEAQF